MAMSGRTTFAAAVTSVAVFVCFQLTTGDDQKSGPYYVDVLGVTECPDPGTNEMIMNVRISKTSRTEDCFSGWYFLPYGLSDDIQEVWEISSQGSTGGWKRLLSFRNQRACSDRKRLFPEWFIAIRASNMSDGSCPIPRGNYTFGCLQLLHNMKFKRAKVMIYGTYKAEIRFYHKGVNIGCVLYKAGVFPIANNTDSGGLTKQYRNESS